MKVGRPKLNIEVGEIYGDLLILEELGRSNHGDVLYKCRCVCGVECVRRASHISFNLKRNCINSCGCRKFKINA